MSRPTIRQTDLLEAIRCYQAERGYSPTVRELCEILGVASTSTVHWHLANLQERGLVTWEPGLTRTLRLTGGGAA